MARALVMTRARPPRPTPVLAKKCSFPNVAPYNACLTLQNAGIVAQCPFAYWTSDNMPFLMAALPPNASTDVLNKTTGFIIPFKDARAQAVVHQPDLDRLVECCTEAPSRNGATACVADSTSAYSSISSIRRSPSAR